MYNARPIKKETPAAAMTILLAAFMLASSAAGRASSPPQASAEAQRLRSECEQGKYPNCSDLGLMYENGSGVAKDASRAVALYQRACEGDHALGCRNLAWLLATTKQAGLGDAKAALPLARKAVQMTDSKNANYLDTLAEALYANGLYAEALETERKALNLDPDNQKWKERVAFFEKAVK